jgi:excisionase family DNA binding protein
MKPRDDATPRRFLTAAEVADYLHVSLATVHRLARHGLIPAFRIGRDYRFGTDEIDRWITDRNKWGV